MTFSELEAQVTDSPLGRRKPHAVSQPPLECESLPVDCAIIRR